MKIASTTPVCAKEAANVAAIIGSYLSTAKLLIAIGTKSPM